jgi:hypothetical protein
MSSFGSAGVTALQVIGGALLVVTVSLVLFLLRR